MHFVPHPAPITKRVIAGFIDAACIIVLSGIAFVAPLAMRGLVLPMWGVLAVMVGYAVVPLAFFKRTLGFHIMGLELVDVRGHAIDLANVTFRELLGRGFFPAAYLLTIVLGLVAAHFGVGANTTPPVLAGVMTFACATALTIALIGHVIALGRPDQRSLADLISRSYVVQGPALQPPTDLEEFDDYRSNRLRVVRNLAVFEVLLALSVFGLPILLKSSSGESANQKIQRLKIEALQAKFDANPISDSLSNELQRELEYAGREADAKAVNAKHVQALSLKEVNREAQLREALSQKRERSTAEALIALLEQQDRVDEARDVYVEWLGEDPTASELSGFGHWLATNGKTEEAVTVLTRATELDPLVPYGQTLLGVSLQRSGQLTLAREHLELALLDDPKDEDAADALQAVEEKVGALSTAGKTELKRRFTAWARDAGR
jgi:uncharacterized RDD family membrane protein YckC